MEVDFQTEQSLLERTENEEELLEIFALEETFLNLKSHFFLLNKIGEGTFSCVYRAVDMHDEEENQLVAVKRLHVTSSATRIANELEILGTLRNSPCVSHLITALRDEDQVLVVMEYKSHTDFRLFYKTCDKSLIQTYMRQLLQGLEFIHQHNVIHRDIKPTNFLFDVTTQRGVLADFGLAEFNSVPGMCACLEGGWADKYPKLERRGGIKVNETRPSKRANRAGTRGFRAPEVLFKCNAQTQKIDLWAAGVILLMFLSKRFPYFNSTDDNEAIAEITVIVGRLAMQRCALLHGLAYEIALPSVTDYERDLSELLDPERLTEEYAGARDLLQHLLDCDYRNRPTAERALCHEFFDGVQ